MKCKHCIYAGRPCYVDPCACCVGGSKYEGRETNADRIRSMSDEELAEFVQTPFCDRIDGKCGGACGICTLDWLRAPAETEGTE